MARVKNPLFSFRASGSFARSITYADNQRKPHAYATRFRSKKSLKNLNKHLHILREAQNSWRTMPEAEKLTWLTFYPNPYPERHKKEWSSFQHAVDPYTLNSGYSIYHYYIHRYFQTYPNKPSIFDS